MDGKDGHELKLEKVGPMVSSLHNCKCHAYNNHQKNTMLSVPRWNLFVLHNSTGTFCVWVKAKSSDFSRVELTQKYPHDLASSKIWTPNIMHVHVWTHFSINFFKMSLFNLTLGHLETLGLCPTPSVACFESP